MDKTILITGAATRIGRTLAIGLAQDGWRIAVHFNRSRDAAYSLLQDLPTDSVLVQANLCVPEERDTLLQRAQNALGSPISALINNASTYAPDSAQTFDGPLYNHHFDVNVKASLMLARDFANQLPDGKTGAIINMVDQRVLRPKPDFFTYTLSKFTLFHATQTLAQALAPAIRVNAIGPGPSLPNAHQSEGEFEMEIDASLLKTGSPPETLLEGVRYLLAARAVTGQMIAIDGGEHLIF